MVCSWLPASGGSTKQYLIQQKVSMAPSETLQGSRKSFSLSGVVSQLGLGAIKLDLVSQWSVAKGVQAFLGMQLKPRHGDEHRSPDVHRGWAALPGFICSRSIAGGEHASEPQTGMLSHVLVKGLQQPAGGLVNMPPWGLPFILVLSTLCSQIKRWHFSSCCLKDPAVLLPPLKSQWWLGGCWVHTHSAGDQGGKARCCWL